VKFLPPHPATMCLRQSHSARTEWKKAQNPDRAASWHYLCTIEIGMETIIEYCLHILFIFFVATTAGTVLLVGFVRLCLHAGLLGEKETEGGVWEFLKSFS
jgi:hypothetical protein